MTMATQFTHHGTDGLGYIDLWAQHADGRAIDEVIVPLAELPSRPDLLTRMPDAMRQRLLAYAGES
jgi:hypothetical protein